MTETEPNNEAGPKAGTGAEAEPKAGTGPETEPGAHAEDEGIAIRGWRVPAILVPWGIQVASGSLVRGSLANVWIISFVVGAIPIVPAVWSLRRESRRRGLAANGLEGLGWTYLVIAAFALVLGLPMWLVSD